jgi:hypothetical protein
VRERACCSTPTAVGEAVRSRSASSDLAHISAARLAARERYLGCSLSSSGQQQDESPPGSIGSATANPHPHELDKVQILMVE